MSRYQPYPSYKDSGVEWLGEVPEHWGKSYLKYISSINMGQSPSSINYNIDGIGMPFLQGNADFGKLYPTARTFTTEIKKTANIEDILFTVRAPVGAMNTADKKYAIGRGLCAITANQNSIQPFLWWLMPVLTTELNTVATGSTYDAVSVEQVNNLTVALPAIEEQTAIAKFLDIQTAKIDTLIAKQQRMIELLGEKRSAMISHTVTKGINPDASMKDSGVEWLGEVPEHWEISKIKFHTIFEGGSTPSKDKPEYWNGDIFWVSPKDMKYRYINSSIDTITVKGQQANNLSIIQAGSVLMVVRSGILQRTIPVGITTGSVTLNQDMKALTFKQEYMAEYFTALVEGLTQQLLLEWRKQGATVESIESEYLANSILPIPPVTERQQIIDYINTQTTKINTLIAKARQAIELMKERRTALISAAVTGKIDVRGVA